MLIKTIAGVAMLSSAMATFASPEGMAGAPPVSKEVQRGQYLATFGGCHDCHSPKMMTPQGPAPDPSRLLSGQPAGAKLPPVAAGVLGPNAWGVVSNGDLTAWVGQWGTSFSANLTPDRNTGIGAWTVDQFIKTIRTGKHLGVGRAILPPMPWFDIAALNDRDLRALFAYLMAQKPVQNRVPEPIPPAAR